MRNNKKGISDDRLVSRTGKQAVVLLSGGLDSAVALYYAISKGFNCSCLIFDYGQRHKREIRSARNIARSIRCPSRVIKIHMPWHGSSLLNKKLDIPKRRQKKIPSTYVPARNIIFLSFALSCAEAIGARNIFIGAHIQDYSGYPDCRPEFYRAFTKAALKGTKTGVNRKGIKIHTPLINKTKAEIVRLGKSLEVPFNLTWSCYSGDKTPCQVCDSCYYRSKGFKEAGIKDSIHG